MSHGILEWIKNLYGRPRRRPNSSQANDCHSDHSFWSSYIKHLPEDSCRSQHADLLGLCHSSSLWYSLDVYYHTLLYCTKRTNDNRDHPPFFYISSTVIFLFYGIDMSLSYQVECTESLMMISGLFTVMNADFAVLIVCHRFWLVLEPLVYNLDIMILTDVPVEIQWHFIVPGDIFCFA